MRVADLVGAMFISPSEGCVDVLIVSAATVGHIASRASQSSASQVSTWLRSHATTSRSVVAASVLRRES